jgi:redox-sensitive bicupin YhaK (pirin superfamily)
MITTRPSRARGHADHGWLSTYHTFSFADYYDPAFMGLRDLRVLNEDFVQAGRGFGTHPHRNMEIITYVIEGALEHRDSMGHGSILRAGEVQRMTAGRGITHSEFNPSDSERVHFLQIWILPEALDLEPEYEQRPFPDDEKQGRLKLIASHAGHDGSLAIHQNVDVFATLLRAGEETGHVLDADRHAWVQVVQGEVMLNGKHLQAGDGAAVSRESRLILRGVQPATCLLFDLA